MIIEASTLELVTGFEILSGFETLYVVSADYEDEAQVIITNMRTAYRVRRLALVVGIAGASITAGVLVSALLVIGSDFTASVIALSTQRSAVLGPLGGAFALAALTMVMSAVTLLRTEKFQMTNHARVVAMSRPLYLAGRHVTAPLTLPLAHKAVRIQSNIEVMDFRIATLTEQRIELQRFRSISSEGQRELRRLNAELTSLSRSRARMDARFTRLLDPRPVDLTLAA